MAIASRHKQHKRWLYLSIWAALALASSGCAESETAPNMAPMLDLNLAKAAASRAFAPKSSVLNDTEPLGPDAGEAIQEAAEAESIDPNPETLTAKALKSQVDLSKCKRLSSTKISIHSPVYIYHYDLDMLGIVEIQSSDSSCIEAAIEDGAEIISQDADFVRLFYPKRFEAFITETTDKIDVKPIEGRWSDIQKRVVPGINGRRVNPVETKKRFLAAIQSQADSFDLAIESIQTLSGQDEIDKFEPSHKLGEFRTTFTRSKNRTINVKLAANALNGIFLMPGAEFSYNDWVGERSEARGYREAPVIEYGQVVEGLGGGACQVSSTVYAAALLSGMGVVERYNHSLPSSYIPAGMDAVVSYPMLDLRLKNTHHRPVVLRVTAEDNVLIAQFYSDKAIDNRVLFRREIIEELPYKEIITVDPKLEPETVKITKRGKLGYRVQRGRISWDGDKENYEKLSVDVYQAQVQHVSIAPDVVYPPPIEDDIAPESL